jgi:hypothetical protein
MFKDFLADRSFQAGANLDAMFVEALTTSASAAI